MLNESYQEGYNAGYDDVVAAITDANRIGYRKGYSAALRKIEEALLEEAKYGGEFKNCCYQIARRLNLIKIYDLI